MSQDFSFKNPEFTRNGRERVAVQLHMPDGEGRTKQSFAKDCDINNLMKHYANTGTINWQNKVQPQYGDYSDVDAYQTAMTTVVEAQQLFDQLPAAVRDRMGNSPEQLMRFMANPQNREQALELGLIEFTESETQPEANTVPTPPPPVEPPPVTGGE